MTEMLVAIGNVIFVIKLDPENTDQLVTKTTVQIGSKHFKLTPVEYRPVDDIIDIPDSRTLIYPSEVSARLRNLLAHFKIKYLEDVFKISKSEMLATPNIGRKSINEMEEMLRARWPDKVWRD